MGNNDKRPKIRFKGFNDDWEQHKLEEIAEFNPKSELPYKFEYVDLESVIGTEMISHRTENKETAPSRAKRLAQYGDIFYQTVRPYQKNNYLFNKLNGDYVFSTGYAQIRAYIDNKFLINILQTNNFVKKVLDNCTGTSYPAINSNELSKLEVKLPSYKNEQNKIGEFFKQLDKDITLHQRKLEKLGNIKKSMLEKMFPKDENKVPEIRFKGFNDDWEQYKLGEISNKVTTKNSSLKYLETFTNSAEYGIISQKDFFENNISKVEKLDRYYVVEPEDFVYNPRISINAPVGPINRNTLDRCGVMSPLYSVFKTHNIDNTYLEYFFKSNYWHSFMFFNGDSGARSDRFSIKDTVFMEMPIPYPNIYEQSKIGVFLKQLDNDITLHQRKLEKLKNIKKACLEKMFA